MTIRDFDGLIKELGEIISGNTYPRVTRVGKRHLKAIERLRMLYG